MKFKHPDTCLEDYQMRRSGFVAGLILNEPDLVRRLQILKEWTDNNSPYEPHERLANLRRALDDVLNEQKK